MADTTAGTPAAWRVIGGRVFVDAEPVRRHLAALHRAGMGPTRVAAASGVARSVVQKLLYGIPSKGSAPSRHIRGERAAALLAVTVRVEDLPPHALVDSTGTVRRMRSLIAGGWSQSQLVPRVGLSQTRFSEMVRGRTRWVCAPVALAAREVFVELRGQLPPLDTRWQRGFYVRAVRTAQRHGWPPWTAWADEELDDPAASLDAPEEPVVDVDEVAVARRLAGVPVGRELTRDERLEAVRRLVAAGGGTSAIGRVLGMGGTAAREFLEAAS